MIIVFMKKTLKEEELNAVPPAQCFISYMQSVVVALAFTFVICPKCITGNEYHGNGCRENKLRTPHIKRTPRYRCHLSEQWWYS